MKALIFLRPTMRTSHSHKASSKEMDIFFAPPDLILRKAARLAAHLHQRAGEHRQIKYFFTFGINKVAVSH